jgi:ribonuclease D
MEARVQFIETAEDLGRFCRRLAAESMIAVDTEADSLFHFREKICLIQLAGAGATAVVDPLNIGDFASMKSLFEDPAVVKVLHGADYDVRSLYRDFGIRINNLFDTELAGRFLGFAHTGLEAMLREHLGVQLNKKFQKKDWSQRPLPPEMVEYAAEDVNHLVRLAGILMEALEKKGRLDWVLYECRLLSQVTPAVTDDQPLFLRVKGAGRLPPRTLAVLEALLQLRNRLAADRDRPVFKVISNRALFQLAETQPDSIEDLKKTGALSRLQIKRYGRAVIEAIAAARHLSRGQLPAYPRRQGPPSLSNSASVRAKALKNWRTQKAAQLGILDQSRLLSKTSIAALATQNPRSTRELARIEDLRPWQAAEFGDELLQTLRRAR